jgi:tetratricopeptide (TPR) repeat protein
VHARHVLALGLDLDPTGQITVTREGEAKTFTRQQCFVEVIKLDPENAEAFLNLALMMHPNPTRQNGQVSLNVNGEQSTFSRRECLIRAIELGAQNTQAFFNLGGVLKQHEEVTLTLGVIEHTFTKQQCYVETLKLDYNHSKAFYNLGVILDPNPVHSDGKVTITLGGEEHTFNKLQCYIETLRRDSNHARAFFNLGDMLAEMYASSNEVVTVTVPIDGIERPLNMQQCFVEALQRDPTHARAYYLLGRTLHLSETIQVGRFLLNIRDCFLRALDNTPETTDQNRALRDDIHAAIEAFDEAQQLENERDQLPAYTAFAPTR